MYLVSGASLQASKPNIKKNAISFQHATNDAFIAFLLVLLFRDRKKFTRFSSKHIIASRHGIGIRTLFKKFSVKLTFSIDSYQFSSS